jgi:hypothetical protein
LFTLQLLDAIAGQVDRHPGNYFINDGKKVTGIDLDYAFGSNSGEKFVMEGGAFSHYPGLPEYVDKEIADKIRNTKPEDIENTIEGLITTDELNKTIERFKFVQKSLDNMHIVKDQAGWKDLSEETKKDEKSYYRKLVNKIDNIDYKNISSRAMGLGWKVEFWDRNYTITIPNKETKEFDSQVDATKYLKFKLDERDKSLMKPFRSGW